MLGKLGIVYIVAMPGGIMSGKLSLTWVGGHIYLRATPGLYLLLCITSHYCSLSRPALCYLLPPCSSSLSKDYTHHENQARLLSVSHIIWIPLLILGCPIILLPSLVLGLLSAAVSFTSKLFWHYPHRWYRSFPDAAHVKPFPFWHHTLYPVT